MSSPALAGLRIDPEKLALLDPAERELVAEELRVVEEAFKRNPLLGYQPHARQKEFHAPPFPPLRAFFGGNRSGKTTAAMVDTIIQAIDDDLVPDHLKEYRRWPAPFKCRIITPDFGDTQEVVLEKIREWCPREQMKGGSFDRAYNKVQRVLWFKNGSRFHFNSNVQDREQLGGSDLHRIVYDEEPRQDLRTESLTRLIDHDGEEIFAMTPLEGMSWLFDEIYDPWERGYLPVDEARVIVVDMDDNPHLSPTGKARALAAYPEHEREARKTGRFVSFAGLIYPMWSEGRYLVPQPSVLPPGVEVFCGIDPGYRHLAVVLYAYLDSDDELVVFDEIAEPRTIISDLCREIQTRNQKWGVRPYWYVIDPAARNKNPQTGRADQTEFSDNGIYTIPGQNAVGTGIDVVTKRLLADKLKVSASCGNLRREFKKYRWVKTTNRGENAAKEAPVKKDDHSLDALRYIVMARPLAPSEEPPPETLTAKDRMLRNHLKRLRKPKPADNGFGPGVFL